MTENRSKATRRRHKRVPLAASVVLNFEEGGDELSLRAMTADISLSGIGLYIERSLQDGAGVTIEISFRAMGGLIKSDAVEGYVVYSNYIKDIYFVGIEFAEELAPSNQPDLYDCLQNILNWD
ncbi:MAG: PilZ domain-containing protein [Nitrospiraceae bacterium]|nr:PilZ domain-containing protein [Nitrospiraceae bacterium]